MAYFREIPYTTLSQLNLDWLIKGLQNLETEISNFVALNTIKYANPFDWDITSQYAMNTLVFNPADYTAYLSVKPVPSGVQIDNADYWTPVFTLEDVLTAYRDAITPVFEQAGSPATTAIVQGQLFWIDSNIYYATAKINQGDTVAIGTNCAATNISAELLKLAGLIGEERTERENADVELQEKIEQAQSDISNEQTERENADSQINSKIDIEIEERKNADTEIIEKLNKIGVPVHYTDHERLYIDGQNGDDSNSGTSEKPFKTLDHFLSLFNSENTDMRCYIVSAGTYTISKPVFQGVTLHITSTVPGVIINNTVSDESMVFYNCHVNLQGNSAENALLVNSAYGKIYGDNCLWTLVNVNFLCAFWSYSGAVVANSCTFTYIRCEKTMVEIYGNTTFTSTTDDYPSFFRFEICQCRIYGTYNFIGNDPNPDSQPSNSCVISAQNSIFSMEFHPSLSKQRQNGLRATNCLVFSTPAITGAFAASGVSGNNTVRTIIVEDNQKLPITE